MAVGTTTERAARLAAEQQIHRWIRQRHDPQETSDAVALIKAYAAAVRAEERAEARGYRSRLDEQIERRRDNLGAGF